MNGPTSLKPTPTGNQQARFGTFAGVVTPSLLTILGVIMFLRFPVIVGYGGLWGALLILLIAKVITFITGLSIASISTNMQVRGGGAYYLISRSLGIESGGMIALFFYAAQAVAISIYVFGFTEAIFAAFPNIGISFIAAATIINIFVFICVYIGANWTIRIQYGILIILFLAIISFWIGAGQNFSLANLTDNLRPFQFNQHSLFTLFALFFPAVTGIMAGVNMSGDLKNPSQSIPKGTLIAIVSTALIYLSIAILLAASNTRTSLTSPGFVIKDTAIVGFFVYAGVFAATLSSALASMMGAPRILQAFAKDNVLGRLKWLGKGSGTVNEPRRAIVITFLIAQAGITTGAIENVAPIITMFFLITYGTINMACFYENISGNPSFRPTFKFHHWSLALLGALSCLVIMFLINLVWAIVAILAVAGIYALITRAEIIVQWGDLQSGLAFQKAKRSLLRLNKERYHPKNWRPSILTLSGGAWNRNNLVQYARLLSANRGMISLAQIITGDLEDRFTRQLEAEKIMQKFIRENEIEAFPVVIVDKSIEDGLKALLQCHGVGEMRPNTVLLGWSQDPEKKGIFHTILRIAKKMERSLLVVRCAQPDTNQIIPKGAINIWWTDQNNGPLMLMMGFLLRENLHWRNCPLRILKTVPKKADLKNAHFELEKILSEARIEAEIIILPTNDPLAAVRQATPASAVLFAGLKSANTGPEHTLEPADPNIMQLPGDIILVYSSGSMSLNA